MYDALKKILEIQERDVKMIRLTRLRRERQKELDNIQSIKNDCQRQLMVKEGEIIDLKKNIRIGETDVEAAGEKVKTLEEQQSNVKKVDEFNALSREIAASEREKAAKEQRHSDMIDLLHTEEEVLGNLKDTLETTSESSQAIEEEIRDSIGQINGEGRGLKTERDKMVAAADPEVFAVYERLLRNKKDQVVVPIESRTCSGCHIQLTAQHENLVRKGERLVFCEHCSRILFWPESELLTGTAAATSKHRRRRSTQATS